MFDIKKGDEYHTIALGTVDDIVGNPEVMVLERRTKTRLFGKTVSLIYICHYYTGMMPPLAPRPQAHALMHYVRTAMSEYRINIELADEFVVAAGDEWKAIPKPNFEGLFISIAEMYGVETGAMQQAWDNVIQTCEVYKLGPIPEVVRQAGPVRIIH